MRLTGPGAELGGERQPRPLIPQRQAELGRTIHAAFAASGQIDLGFRSAPSDAKLAVSHGDAGIADPHHAELAQ